MSDYRFCVFHDKAGDCVVVVCSCVERALLRGLRRLCHHLVCGELPYVHAREAAELYQVVHACIERAEIFREQLHAEVIIRQHGFDRSDEISAGALLPQTVYRLFAFRDRVILRQRTEVIDPEDVEPGRALPDPAEPPAVAVFLKCIPVVERVPPVLAVLAEIVRRDSGMDTAPAVFIHPEDSPVRPDISTVRRHIHRDVAHHPDAAAVRVFFKRTPFSREPVLLVHDAADQIGLFFLGFPERFFNIRQPVLIRPVREPLSAELFLYRTECRVCVQPPRILPAELIISAVVRQLEAVDQSRVARECRCAVIWRSAKSRRVHGEYLPYAESCACDIINKISCFLSERLLAQ